MSLNKLFQSVQPQAPKPESQAVDAEIQDEAPKLEAAKQISRGFFQKASKRAAAIKKTLSNGANRTAQKLAETCEDWTGKEVDVVKLKKAATIGAVVGTGMAVGPMVGMAMRQAHMQNMQNGMRQNPWTGASGNGTDEAAAGSGGESIMPSPDMPLDDSAAIEQDAIDYDNQQYDQFQDHLDHNAQLDDVISDDISYNESMDFGGFDSFDC